MSISFNEIQSSRRPWVQVEYDSSNALVGPQTQPYKALIMGQKLSGGSASAGEIHSVTSADQALELFGNGSMLHNMAQVYFQDPSITDLSMVAITEPTGTKSSGDVSFSGTATASGTINLYIAGRKITAAVTSGDAAADVASAVASAINADTDLPVTAEVNGSDDTQVDITARQVGLAGDTIDIRFNYAAGDVTPAGITPSLNAMSSGAGAVSLTNVITAMGGTHYNILVSPWTDSTTLATLETELDSRGNASKQIEGLCIAAVVDTVSTANTLGNSENSKWISLANLKGSPTPGYEVATSIAKQVMVHGAEDPARPFQTLKLYGVKAPAVADRLTPAERESHLNNGISSLVTTDFGDVLIERLITTYKTNGQGAADVSYLDVNTLLTLSYIRYDFRNSMAIKFPRHKLAKSLDRIAPGQKVLTPDIAKAHAIQKFQSWQERAIVEDIDQFKADLVVEINSSSPNRLDMRLPVNLVNQNRQTAVQIGFIL